MDLPARRPGSTILSVSLVLAVGYIDYITGPDFGLSLFYILPIAHAGWRFGRSSAWMVAVVASLCWFSADLMWRAEAEVTVSLWNGFTRLAIYVFVATTTATIRADRDQLRALLHKAETSARTDALTGLANARAFLERVGEEIARARRLSSGVCLAYIDLDCFKAVNDRYGHGGGDDVLRRIATVLQEVLRDVDVAARLGGDEFAVLLVDADPAGAQAAAERVVARVAAVGADYPDTGLGASVGVAWFAAAPKDADALLNAADHAMYRAKAAGKGTLVFVKGDEGNQSAQVDP